MEKATAKLLLEAHRPRDAGDPIFAEALREVARHPDLAAWFEEMQRLDALLAAKLQEVAVPEEVRSHILMGLHAPAPAKTWAAPRRWVLAGSIAAALLLGLLCWRVLAPRHGPMNALALQAASFTEQMPPLQFVCFNAEAVANWINEQPAARSLGVALPKPAKSLSMAMIGSSVVDWNGKTVLMICLQNGQRMAMLYIVDAAEAATMAEGASETFQTADWVVRGTKANGRVRLLTTKGRPEDLDFPTPF